MNKDLFADEGQALFAQQKILNEYKDDRETMNSLVTAL